MLSSLVLQFHLYSCTSLIPSCGKCCRRKTWVLCVVEEGELSIFWESRGGFPKKCHVLGKIIKVDGVKGKGRDEGDLQIEGRFGTWESPSA